MERSSASLPATRWCVLAIALALIPGFARAADDAGALFFAGQFDAAASAYAATLARDPSGAAANLGLGTIELYRNDLAQAEPLLRNALSNPATAERAQRQLRILAGRRGVAGQYQMHWTAGWPATVTFVQTDPLPVIKVRVNNKRDAYFLIDTGAPDIALDTAFAKELRLKTQSAGMGVFAGGRRAPVLSAVLPSLTLGGVQIGNVPARLLPTRSFGGQYRIDGVIGTGLLMHFLSTLDYIHGKLSLAPPLAAAFSSTQSSSGATVPMWLVGDHFIFARGRINDGPEALFNIDTGLAGGGVQATKAEIDAAHITLDEAHASTGMGGGGPVRFIPFKALVAVGDASVTDVPGIYTPDGDQFGIFPFSVAGTISHSFFRRFSVAFDFVNMRMLIERP